MKIAVIHGQAHKKNTFKVTQLLLQKLNCSEEDIVELNVNKVSPCCGCAQCIMKDESFCPHYEQISSIIKTVDESDVIILDSPNYCMGMTGQLKSFCDHLAYRWMSHRPVDMRSKIGVSISTTAGTGASKTTKQIAEQMIWWSMGRVYQIAFTIGSFSIEEASKGKLQKLDKNINKIAKNINKKVRNSNPCFKTRFYFKMMTIMQKRMPWNQVETDYWKSQGWIK